jgi:hypothetical protein
VIQPYRPRVGTCFGGDESEDFFDAGFDGDRLDGRRDLSVITRSNIVKFCCTRKFAAASFDRP